MASLSEAPTSTAEIADRWGAWWQAVAAFGIESSVDLSPAAPQAAHVLDDAVRRVATVRRERDRRLNMMRQLLVDLIEESPIERPDLDSLRAASAAAKRTVEEAQVALASVEAAAAEARRRQVELHEARAELQALAQLALRHLGEHCPVCDQTYDSVATRARLEWIAANSGDEDAVRAPAANEVSVAAEGLRAAEEASAVADQQLRVAEALIREADLREQDLTSRLTSIGYVGLPDADAVSALEIQTATLDREISSCEELSAEGERLAVAIARIGEATQRDELQRDIASSRQRLQELEDEIAKREVTSALAVRLLAGLREASSNVVTSELERIDPLLQQIFSTIDPHPAFRAVRLLTTFAGRRGRVMAQLKDQLSGKVTDSPEMVLSSSQLNGLAVSIFLALNLGVRALPIDSVILDDPLQSLDDVNLLGLVDLLRRIREHRQLIVSTHDMRFGDLLARKLRPVAQHQRTLVYRFRGWSRFGPSLEMEEVPFDRVRLRIASSAA
jgi:DNA repair exonuclease SbcCD ATPase subunit